MVLQFMKNEENYLINVGTLNLWHFPEGLSKQLSIIVGYSAYLIPTLITIKAKFFSLQLNLLAFLG